MSKTVRMWLIEQVTLRRTNWFRLIRAIGAGTSWTLYESYLLFQESFWSFQSTSEWFDWHSTFDECSLGKHEHGHSKEIVSSDQKTGLSNFEMSKLKKRQSVSCSVVQFIIAIRSAPIKTIFELFAGSQTAIKLNLWPTFLQQARWQSVRLH